MTGKQNMRPLSIGKLAASGGVGAETIRFYQRRGLLETPVRNGGSIRRYGQEDVRRLQFIREAQTAGFSLDEIKELFELATCEDRKVAHEIATARADVLDDKIAVLQRMSDALRRLAHGSGSSIKELARTFAPVGHPQVDR